MIVKVNKTKNYSVMSNHHLRNKEMSLKAKGLLSLMLSLPDDWEYSIDGLASLNKDNETSINSALKELKENGYLVVQKLKPNETNTGRYEYVYNVFEIPIQELKKQGVEILGLEILGLENLCLNKIYNIQNTNIQNTKDINIKEIPKESKTSLVNEIFDYWNSKGIIKHNELTETRKSAISKALKKYESKTIISAINHYSIVLKDKTHYFSYKWSIEDFLNRKNGISAFLDDGSIWVNYVGNHSSDNDIHKMMYRDNDF